MPLAYTCIGGRTAVKNLCNLYHACAHIIEIHLNRETPTQYSPDRERLLRLETARQDFAFPSPNDRGFA